VSNLYRRLKKLEAQLTDDTGLVPGSKRWMDYWLEQFDKVVRGGDEAKNIRLPLEIFDAVVKAAESEGVMGMNVVEEWDLNEQKSISPVRSTGTTVDT
jgi:hypothetical protein